MFVFALQVIEHVVVEGAVGSWKMQQPLAAYVPLDGGEIWHVPPVLMVQGAYVEVDPLVQ